MTPTIPQKIIEDGLFCCWRYEERNGKQTKVPYNPRTGERAKSNDPQSFTDYQTASRVSHQYDGMGLGIFNGICAIDLDHCIDADGSFSQVATEIIAMMHSYTERAPAGLAYTFYSKLRASTTTPTDTSS